MKKRAGVRGERTMRLEHDLALTQTAVAEAWPEPAPENPARGLAELPTETVAPPPGPTDGPAPPKPVLLHAGATLKHYEILRKLGEGGMGTVLLARGEAMVEGMLGTLEHTQSSLPLLQFTASKLWEARDRERLLLTRDSYDKLGGVAGALSAHADTVLSGLSSVEQRLCRAVLLRLCTPERTRAVVSLTELRALTEDSGAVEQVIHRLSDARLVLIETGGEREGATVELVHESLIERWAKLKQWLSESEQDA
jgi:hypothetical protein